MEISELIKTLEYVLKSSGDSEVYISIDTTNKHKLDKAPKDKPTMFTTENLVTSLDVLDGGKTQFGIRNWSM